ncbi:hypothetical protein D3C71_809700 [compost metagenome]
MEGDRDSEQVVADLLDALQQLHALVWGECPSLLNEDSGGNSALDMQVHSAIESGQRYQKENT